MFVMPFLREFIRDPVRTGAVAGSSRFLARKMLAPIDFKRARFIVEIGAGEGAFTRQLLNRMREDAKLVSVEINPEFAVKLRKIKDKRLKVVVGDAARLRVLLKGKVPEYIVSGVPIGIMPSREVIKILKEIKATRSPLFIQFQYTPRWHRTLKRMFDIRVSFTPFNIPPALVYACRQKKEVTR